MEKTVTKHDGVDVEKTVLAILINSQSSRHQHLMQIKSDDFLVPKNRIIFEAILKLATDVDNNFDLLILSSHLKKTKRLPVQEIDAYLGEITESFVSDQLLADYLKILVDNSTTARIQQKLKTWAKLLTTKNVKLDKVLTQIDLQTKQLFDFYFRNQISLKPLNKIVSEVANEWKKFDTNYRKVTCTTGFPSLNEKTHGFQKGDLIILAARPSMGKTALALKVAVSNATEYTDEEDKGDVIIFSLEMSSYQLVQRILSTHLSKINLRFVKESDYQEIQQFSDDLAGTNIFVDTSMATDVHTIGFKLRSWAQKRKIRLVIIDYLQLLKPVLAEKFDNRNLEVAHWTRILKEIARELSVPVLCLSQLSRYVDKRDDKRPVLSDLRDSGSIEQDADLVLFLYREDYYQKKNVDSNNTNVSKVKSDPSKTELIIAKHRNGPIGVVDLMFIPSKVTFYEYKTQ